MALISARVGMVTFDHEPIGIVLYPLVIIGEFQRNGTRVKHG